MTTKYKCYGDIVNTKLVVRAYEVLETIERDPPIDVTPYGPMEDLSDTPEQAVMEYKARLALQIEAAENGVDAAKEVLRKAKHRQRMTLGRELIIHT